MGTGDWNLEVAFDEYYDGRETFAAKRSSGFGSAQEDSGPMSRSVGRPRRSIQ